MSIKAMVETALYALSHATGEAVEVIARILKQDGAGFVVIWSDSERLDDGEPAFWSNQHGWGPLANATVFSVEESRSFTLPNGGASSDSRWVGVLQAFEARQYWQDQAEMQNADKPDWHRHGLWIAVDADGKPVEESLATTAYSARAEFLRARNKLWSQAVKSGAYVQELVLSGPKMQ